MIITICPRQKFIHTPFISEKATFSP